jgi:SAM-dependent MidA family methyltransferase
MSRYRNQTLTVQVGVARVDQQVDEIAQSGSCASIDYGIIMARSYATTNTHVYETLLKTIIQHYNNQFQSLALQDVQALA